MNTKSKDELELYLQDHYAAAIGALELLEHLEKAHAEDSLGAFFGELHADIEADHEQLGNLMSALGLEVSGVRNAGAWTAEKFSRVKLGFSDSDSKLRLLQSLETIFIGITGKKLLWCALQAVQASSPILKETDLALLEKRAIEQAERVETERIKVAQAAFA